VKFSSHRVNKWLECLRFAFRYFRVRNTLFDIQNSIGSVARLAVACFVVVAGCQRGPEMVPLHGQVHYQGNPLEYGGVMFQPVGGGTLARGQIQPDGSFVLTTKTKGDGVKRGLCRVRVTAFESQRSGGSANVEGDMPLGESAIPSKYQSFGASGIEIEVTPDMQQPVIIELE